MAGIGRSRPSRTSAPSAAAVWRVVVPSSGGELAAVPRGRGCPAAGDAARRAVEGESGAALEARGEALYLERKYAAAATCYERAYVAHRRERQFLAAGRAARTVSWITGNVLGDWAVQSGWLGRARSVLAEVGEDSPEHGWALILQAFAEPDPAAREVLLRDAIAIGRRLGDPDVEFEALVCLGGVFLMTGRVEEGLVLIDEALAAACAGELAEIATVDSIFCLFFWACELVNDVPRADQWMRRAAELMQRHNVAGAFCRAHYGAILTAAGRWDEAEAQLVESTRLFDGGMPRAAALIRLADLRLRQGRLEEAAQLLDGLDTHPDAVRTLAALHLARGAPALARDLLERGTAGSDDAVPRVGETSMIGPLLALLVDVHLAEGDIDGADRAAKRLGRLAEAQRGPYLTAAAALARGRVCVASGQGDARSCMHAALAGFAQAQLPMELAITRLELARAQAARTARSRSPRRRQRWRPSSASTPLGTPTSPAALLRSLGAPVRTGPKGVGALTKRESEVLELIGAGLSNVEIGERLFITRKTVEHHVGNVLAKLGLRNRAQAAAYATRHKPAGE